MGVSAERIGSADARFSRTLDIKKRVFWTMMSGRAPSPRGRPAYDAAPQVRSVGCASLRPASVRSSVDFPPPAGPSRSVTPAAGTRRSTSASTTRSPNAVPKPESSRII